MIDQIFQKEVMLTKQKCDNCHYWYCKDIGFEFEPYLCNGCHDLQRKAIDFNDIATVSVKAIYFCHMSKDDAIRIMNNSNLNDKSSVL